MSGRLDALIGVAAAVPLLSALRSPVYPLSIRVALGLMWLLAAWRPADALVLLALVVPFGSAVLVWLDMAPVRLAEAFVIATLSGAWISSVHTPAERRTTPGGRAALAFAIVVLASLAVVLAGREVGLRSPRLELRNLWMFLTHDYLVGPAPEFAGLADALLLLEGVGLMWIVRRDACERTTLVVGAFVASALGAAWMAYAQAAGFAADAHSVMAGLLGARASGPANDVNAAGSFFAMAASLAFGMAVARRASTPARAAWGVMAAAFVGAVWLSGSRMALVAAIAGAALLVAYERSPDQRQRRRAVAALAVAAALVLMALTVGLDPRPAASRTAADSFSRRGAFMVTGLRMIASAPAFGVGVGRYYELSGRFMPSSIYWFHFHENAHNNFLQIGGELGLLGLAVFLWLLVAAKLRLLRAVKAKPDDALLAASGVAVAAFVLTWLTSHPLLVPEIAYAFWIVFGAAVARADALLADDDRGATPADARQRVALAAVAVLAIASAPFRTAAARPTERLDQVTFGLYDWEDDNGVPYRWTSRRATFFIPAGARELHLPVRSMMISGHTEPVTFSVAVNGRVLDTFPITQGNWETVDLRLPARTGDGEFTRIDVITEPPWTPAAAGAGQDVRVLGVQLGRPEAQ